MSLYQFTNNANTTLGSAISSGATTITVATGTGILFPTLGTGQYFTATLFAAGSSTGLPNEIVRVTARTGDTMTVLRGQEGTTAQSWNVGDSFSNFITAGLLNNLVGLNDVQSQFGNSAVDAGSTNAGVVTLSPAITSLASILYSPIRVLKINTANTGAYTLNVNGLGAKSVVFNGSALTNNQLAAGSIYQVAWDGTNFELLSSPVPAAATAPVPTASGGVFTKLKISTLGISNYTSTITANSVTLANSSGLVYIAQSVSLTPNINTSGVNGLDTGTVAGSTWYYAYAIYNPTTTTVAAVFSLSATAPTLPSGYTYYARLGAVRTDGSANKYLLQTLQFNRTVYYLPLSGSNTTSWPLLASGTMGTFTASAYSPVAVSLSSVQPPTSANARILGSAPSGTNALAFSSAYYAGVGGWTSSLPPQYNNFTYANADNASINGVIENSDGNVYFASNSSGHTLRCTGFEDNL